MLHTPRPMPHDFREIAMPHTITSVVAEQSSKTSKKKSGGHVRRQNRSCDQCRKGKRRCDAAVLRDREDGTQSEDQEWDIHNLTQDPAPCTYCTKTKKQCTFEWLRSQESHLRLRKDVAKSVATKPSKRMRLEDSTSSETCNTVSQTDPSTSPDSVEHVEFFDNSPVLNNAESLANYAASDPALHQFSFDASVLDLPPNTSFPVDACGTIDLQPAVPVGDYCSDTTLTSQLPSPNSNASWDLPTANDIAFLQPKSKRPLLTYDEYNAHDQVNVPSVTLPIGLLDPSPLALSDRLARSVNNHLVSESMMRIYHDSLETALSCWLAERTCPYINKKQETRLIASSAYIKKEDWNQKSRNDILANRMFKRVYRLDRRAGKIRTRPLSQHEEMQASKALYLVIMAFATQWSQGSDRSRAEHAIPAAGNQRQSFLISSSSPNNISAVNGQEYDRQLHENYWHEARQALLLCAETESFKVAFANIIFSFTQKPLSPAHRSEIRQKAAASPVFNADSFDLRQIEDEIDRVLAEDGPPMYFEQGIRSVHTLRDRLIRLERELEGTGEKVLDDEDRMTVELMAWLGYMGDTLVSTVLQRPLVVADEYCDVLPEAVASLRLSDEEERQQPGVSKLWSDFIFLQERFNRGEEVLRYPCTYDQAAAGLTDAAPVKVLLYRKVQVIQNLVSRHALATSIEQAIQEARGVYHHWKVVYEPFVQDLIEHHDSLHPRLQSWYICLTAHHYLATLLFADAMYQVDAARFGLTSHRFHRESGNVVSSIRRHSALLISSVAHRATPHHNASFPQSDYHHAMNAGALLTEPWTALLIRAFFKATILLLQDAASPAGQGEGRSKLIRAAEECVRAIKYLGRKSDTAVLAGEMLDAAIANQERDTSQQSTGAEFIPDNFALFGNLCNDEIGQEFELLL